MEKAFTLVELLAIIIILGIISLITTPIISVQITKSKISAYRINVQNIIDEAKEYATHNTKSNDFPKDGINYKSLGLKIDNIKSGLIKKNELGEIEAIDIYNGKYCASGTKNNIIVKKVSSENECKTIDYTGPELTLKQVKITSNSIMINAYGYDSQTEIYSYTFQIGNNTPKEIITNSKVASYEFKNLKSNTEYEITVSVKNKNALSNDSQYKNNKESTTTTRKILVKTLDIGIPTFEITSNGYSKTKQVTINYPSINGINGYKFDEKDVIVNNNIITLDITKNGKIEAYTNYNGEILKNTLNIYGIDDKGPEIISVDNPDTWEKTKVITVTVKDTGSGLPEKACSFDGGKTWTNYKTSEGKTICSQAFTENKVIDFKVRDRMNSITDIESYLNGNKIVINKVDRTAPTCTLKITSGTLGTDKWYRSNIVVGISSVNDEAIDYNGNKVSGSGVVTSEISNNTKEPLTKTVTSNFTSITTTVKYDGRYKVTGKVTDKAGNIGTCTIDTNRDTVAPTTPKITNPTNGNWTRNSFSLTLNSTDALSGINNYQYSYNNESWTTYPSSNKTSYTTPQFTADINQAVYVRSCDKAGNCSSSSSTMIRIFTSHENDPHNNWSTTREIKYGSTTENQVLINGNWYTVHKRSVSGWSDNSFQGTTVDGNMSIPLPKGLSSATLPCSWYGANADRSWGWIEASIVDNTTGQTLWSGRSGKNESGSSRAYLTFSREQATHNIVLKMSGRAHGEEYNQGAASIGLGTCWYGFCQGGAWKFTYY